jgi:hypothetical protein
VNKVTELLLFCIVFMGQQKCWSLKVKIVQFWLPPKCLIIFMTKLG